MAKEKRIKEQDPNKVPFGKLLAWNTRPIALGSITIIIGYFSIYCTDTLGMNPALVGTLLMASKILDGFTDLIAGYFVDNTKTKWGKARPYEICIILAWLGTVLLFSARTEWSTVAKSIWIFTMYTLVFSIFSTFLNAAESPYIIRAFGTKEAVTKVSAIGGIIITMGCMIIGITFPIMMGNLATSDRGWTKLMLIYAIPLTLIGILRFIFVKEKYTDEDVNSPRVTLKDMFTMLRSNPYTWCMAGVNGVTQLIAGLGAVTYYFTWIVGDISKLSMLQLFSILCLFVMLVFPVVIRKKSANYLIMIGAILGIVGYSINFFAGKSLVLLTIASLLGGVAVLPGSYLRTIMVMEIAKYNQWKGLPSMEATAAALANFFGKVFTAFGSFILGILLTAGGYDGTLAVQSESALNMIRLLYSVIPAASMCIMLFCALVYRKLDKQLPQIEAELAAREAAN